MDIKTIRLILGGCIFILFIILGLRLVDRGFDTYGSIIITSAFAGVSIYLAIKSSIIMGLVREANIQDVIIKLLDIRRRLFDDFKLYYKKELAKREIQGSIEWTTWTNYRIIVKAMKYKKYLLDSEYRKDKNAILNSHRILINNVMKKEHIGEFLMNRHVNQLLMGIKKLKEELQDLTVEDDNYEQIYEKLLEYYLLERQKGEHFISWIDKNLKAVSDEDKPFRILRD